MKRGLATATLRHCVTLRSRTVFVILAVLGILAVIVPLGVHASPTAAATPNPTWYVDAPILYRTRAEPYDHYAVKDPTIVFSGGRWHMFYTGANASGGWQMLILGSVSGSTQQADATFREQ